MNGIPSNTDPNDLDEPEEIIGQVSSPPDNSAPWLQRAALAFLGHRDRVEALALIRGATGCSLEEAKSTLLRMCYSG